MKSVVKQTQTDQSIGNEATWLELIRRQVSSLDYGTVQIVVHDSRVVQVDRTEKVRLTNPIASNDAAV